VRAMGNPSDICRPRITRLLREDCRVCLSCGMPVQASTNPIVRACPKCGGEQCLSCDNGPGVECSLCAAIRRGNEEIR
jgi:hypothetical protein